MTITLGVWVLYAVTLSPSAGDRPAGETARLVAPRRPRTRRRRPPTDPLRVVKLALAGVSHHTAPIELRERVAIDAGAAGAIARDLASGDGQYEAVVLSTCNRTELYVASRDGDAAGPPRARSSRWPATTQTRSRRSPTAWRTSRPRSTSSASRPASTRSYPGRARSSARCGTPSRRGAAGPLLDRTFRMALHAGRRARLETAIGESPASVPAAAAALAQQVFDGLDGRRVVLVGAGRTSEVTARNLRSRGAIVTRRRQQDGRSRGTARGVVRRAGCSRSTTSPPRSRRRTSSSRRRARPDSS